MGAVQAEVYRGSTIPAYLSRNIEECEAFWTIERTNVATLDGLLSKQLLLARDRGENQITVVDIGCGEGTLLNDFLNHQVKSYNSIARTTPRTQRYLRENPEMHIQMIGLTDAASEDSHLTSQDIPILPHNYSSGINAEAKIVDFSLTKDQTYADFLQSQNITSVNLTLATFSMGFFHPFLFRDTLETIVTSLCEGGVLIAVEYGRHAGKMLSRYTRPPSVGTTNSGALNLLRRDSNLIRSSGNQEASAPAKLVRFLELVERYKSTLDEQYLLTLDMQIENRRDSPDLLLALIASETILIARELQQAKKTEVKKQKDASIKDLKDKVGDNTTFFTDSKNLFVIKSPNADLSALRNT